MIKSVVAASVLGAGVLVAGSPSVAHPRTIELRGSYTEHAVIGAGCQSPVGLSVAGQYRGTLRGAFHGVASSISPTPDTPTTTVAAFTADSDIIASVNGLHGTLTIKNAGVFSSQDGGPIVDVQTIIGGTGDFSGASGFVRASGTFSFVNGGRSEYVGSVSLS
jgi:hypothetical protein